MGEGVGPERKVVKRGGRLLRPCLVRGLIQGKSHMSKNDIEIEGRYKATYIKRSWNVELSVTETRINGKRETGTTQSN